MARHRSFRSCTRSIICSSTKPPFRSTSRPRQCLSADGAAAQRHDHCLDRPPPLDVRFLWIPIAGSSASQARGRAPGYQPRCEAAPLRWRSDQVGAGEAARCDQQIKRKGRRLDLSRRPFERVIFVFTSEVGAAWSPVGDSGERWPISQSYQSKVDRIVERVQLAVSRHRALRPDHLVDVTVRPSGDRCRSSASSRNKTSFCMVAPIAEVPQCSSGRHRRP